MENIILYLHVSFHVVKFSPVSRKHGNLYALLLAWVTGATKTDPKVITPEQGRGWRKRDRGTAGVEALVWLEGRPANTGGPRRT